MNLTDLRKLDLSDHLEKKGQLSYVSWASAWDFVLQVDPNASFMPILIQDKPLIPAGIGYMVMVNVTISGITKTCHLPVLDHRNKPIADPNCFDTNTAIMRCVAKCCALFGLGLYVYRGEDLPPSEGSTEAVVEEPKELTLEDRKKLHDAVFEGNTDKVIAIKDSIASGEYAAGAQIWFELDNEIKHALWLAPRDGGCFTTKERQELKSPEFRKAYYGDEK